MFSLLHFSNWQRREGSVTPSGGTGSWCSEHIDHLIPVNDKWVANGLVYNGSHMAFSRARIKCRALDSWFSVPSQWTDLIVSFTDPVKDRLQGKRIAGSRNHVLFSSRWFGLTGKAFLDLGVHPKIWRKLDSYSKIKVTVRMAGKKSKSSSCEQFTYIWYRWWAKLIQIKGIMRFMVCLYQLIHIKIYYVVQGLLISTYS